MKNIMLLTLFVFGFQTLAKEIPVVRQDREYVVQNQVSIFLNHSTSTYDGRHLSLQGVKQLVSWGKELEIPIIVTKHGDAFFDEGSEAEYFIRSSKVFTANGDSEQRRTTSDDADVIVHSDGGAHLLKFPNAKTVIMGGGNLRNCLCESVRDVVAGFGDFTGHREVILVREATYDYDIFGAGMPVTNPEVRQFVNKFFLPDFPCPYQVSTGFGPVTNLKQVRLEFYSNGKLVVKREVPNAKATLSVHIMPFSMMLKHFEQVSQ